MHLLEHGADEHDLRPGRADTGVLSLSHQLERREPSVALSRYWRASSRKSDQAPLPRLTAFVVIPRVEMHAGTGWRLVSSVAFVAGLRPGRVPPGLRPR